VKKIALLSLAERRGPAATYRQKKTSLFYGPAVRQGLVIPEADVFGLHLVLPFSPEAWARTPGETRAGVTARVMTVVQRQGVSALGIRRGQGLENENMKAWRGEVFLAALARLKVQEALEQGSFERVIVVGDSPLSVLIAWQIKLGCGCCVVLRSSRPSRLERAAEKLRFQEGLVLPLSCYTPQGWEKKDLVVFLDFFPDRDGFLPQPASVISLYHESRGHAPFWEKQLEKRGIDCSLGILAPFLEALLLADQKPDLDFQKAVHLLEARATNLLYHFLNSGTPGEDFLASSRIPLQS